MVQKHVAFAPGNKWGQAPFCKKEDILIQKMGPGPIYSHLFPRLRSPLLWRETVPAQPFSRFFTIQLSPSRKSDGVGRRVCLSEASYAAAEKNECRMALKI